MLTSSGEPWTVVDGLSTFPVGSTFPCGQHVRLGGHLANHLHGHYFPRSFLTRARKIAALCSPAFSVGRRVAPVAARVVCTLKVDGACDQGFQACTGTAVAPRPAGWNGLRCLPPAPLADSWALWLCHRLDCEWEIFVYRIKMSATSALHFE